MEQKMKRRLIIFSISIIILVVIYIINKPYGILYSYPVWSKDGNKIYFTKEVKYVKYRLNPLDELSPSDSPSPSIDRSVCYIMSMNADGSWKKVVISFKGGRQNFPYLYDFRGMKITPDGKNLVFEMNNAGGTFVNIYQFAIYVIEVNGKNLKKIVFPENGIEIIDFYISPDSKKILYSRKSKINNAERFGSVWLVNIDGSNDHMICEEDSYAEGWTAEGNIIISWHDQMKKEWQLWLYNLSLQSVSKKVNFRWGDHENTAKTLGLITMESQILPDGKKELLWKDHGLLVKDLKTNKERLIINGLKGP